MNPVATPIQWLQWFFNKQAATLRTNSSCIYKNQISVSPPLSPTFRKETVLMAPNPPPPPCINVSTLVSGSSQLSDENYASWCEQKSTACADGAVEAAHAHMGPDDSSALLGTGIVGPSIKKLVLPECYLFVPKKTRLILKNNYSNGNSWSYK
jgi:hypothetical protein